MSIGIRTDVKSFDDVRKSLGMIDRVLSEDGTVRTIQSDGTPKAVSNSNTGATVEGGSFARLVEKFQLWARRRSSRVIG